MARTDNLKNYLTDVADAIREKTNTTDKIKASEFDDKIKEISGDSEQWEWALNNVINFDSANPTFFKGMTYLKVLPNYFNEECAKITNWGSAFNGCSNLVDIDIDTSAGTDFNNIFYGCSKLNVIKNMDTSKGKNFTNAFRGCNSLTDETIKNLKFDNITNGFGMFYATFITKLPNFNHETITNMQEMFWESKLSDLEENDLSFPLVTNFRSVFGSGYKIAKVPNILIPKATTTYYAFGNCTSLMEVRNIEAPLATTAQRIFEGCTKLESIGNLNLSVCTNVNNAFFNCTNLKAIGALSIPKVQTFSNSFYNCSALESIEQIDVSSATTLNSLFKQSNNLKSIDFVNTTSKVTDFYILFSNKTALETVNGLDLSSATNVFNMFANCSNLKNLTFVENSIKISLNLEDSPLLTDESIQNFINGLATVETAQNLTLHSDIVGKLTEEQKATITSKNWNVVVGGGKRTELEVTEANELIATIGGRKFTKTNDGLAVACVAKFGNYVGILLVSEIEDAVAFSVLGTTQTSAGSLTYNDKTYYYSNREYFMGSQPTISSNYPRMEDISGTTSYSNNNSGSEQASIDLLNYYFHQ